MTDQTRRGAIASFAVAPLAIGAASEPAGTVESDPAVILGRQYVARLMERTAAIERSARETAGLKGEEASQLEDAIEGPSWRAAQEAAPEQVALRNMLGPDLLRILQG